MHLCRVPRFQARRRPRRWSLLAKEADGQLVVFTAIALFVLIGFLACATDVGLLLAARRGEQNAVDAASLAVANAIYSGVTSQTTLKNLAAYYIQQNGFSETPTITVNMSTEQVTVSLTHQQQKYFVGVVYPGPWTVTSSATAAIEPTPRDYALLALNQQGPSISIQGNGSMNITGGGAMSDGSLTCQGSGTLTADGTIDAHSGESFGNCNIKGAQGQNPNAATVPDPFASLAAPQVPNVATSGSAAACSQSGSNYTCPDGDNSSSGKNAGINGGTVVFASGTHVVTNTNISGSSITFNPGTYYFLNSTISSSGNNSIIFNPGSYTFYMDGGSIDLSGSTMTYSGSTLATVDFYFHNTGITFCGSGTNLPPGMYYFDGNGPSCAGNGTVAGKNVFFYFANGATWTTKGTPSYQFSAPDPSSADGASVLNALQGWYPSYPKGLLFYGQRDGTAQSFSINGNNGIKLTGIVYLPNASLDLSGDFGGSWANGQFIVNTIHYTGNFHGQIDYHKFIQIYAPAVYLIQ